MFDSGIVPDSCRILAFSLSYPFFETSFQLPENVKFIELRKISLEYLLSNIHNVMSKLNRNMKYCTIQHYECNYNNTFPFYTRHIKLDELTNFCIPSHSLLYSDMNVYIYDEDMIDIPRSAVLARNEFDTCYSRVYRRWMQNERIRVLKEMITCKKCKSKTSQGYSYLHMIEKIMCFLYHSFVIRFYK